jgi:undecaprenyl diphosphate synthase
VGEALGQAGEGRLSAAGIDDFVTEECIGRHLDTCFMPDPDLLIRTGGELRISNYLLWQIAYSELYFCDTYWPDFGEEELHEAISAGSVDSEKPKSRWKMNKSDRRNPISEICIYIIRCW